MSTRMKKSAIVIIFLTIMSNSFSQNKTTVGAIAFYNVENFFDTIDDPEKKDEEYTPNGEKQWTLEKYNKKKENLAKVLSSMAKGADIIGLSEIENLFVVQDLIKHPKMKHLGYQIIHKESPDIRGIDCALLYKPRKFKVVDFNTIAFGEEGYTTRDILHVRGIYFGDTLDVFVNHWPSRFGGQGKRRCRSAQLVRDKVNKLTKQNPNAKIVIMGDLNDDPINKSVKKVLAATDNSKLKNGQLFNPAGKLYKQGIGTLSFDGAWNLFDQIIISRGLMQGAGIRYQKKSFSIYAPDWMRVSKGNYRGVPKRTFVRGVFKNGYSDHFPTYILIEK